MSANSVHAEERIEPTPAEFQLRKQKFARVLASRAKLGYEIESQTETSAVLVIRGRKRMFGMRGGTEQRTELALSDEGTVVTRDI